jgi:phosphate uptake regulator
MNRATQALLDADLPLAEAVIDFDAKVDTLASDVEERCFELVFHDVTAHTGLGAD